MRIIFLVGVLVCGANAQQKRGSGKVEKPEKTFHVELADRVVTVQRLKGPPAKEDRKSTPPRVNTQTTLPIESFFVNSIVCEDGRTYLEWWSLSQSPRVVYQAWSDLNWKHSGNLNSFQHERRKYAVMHFPTASSKDELAKLGKPHDPNVSRRMSRSQSKNMTFTRVDQNQITTSSLRFMNACHEYLESRKQLHQPTDQNQRRPSSGKTIAPKKKLSTLRYWRAK